MHHTHHTKHAVMQSESKLLLGYTNLYLLYLNAENPQRNSGHPDSFLRRLLRENGAMLFSDLPTLCP